MSSRRRLHVVAADMSHVLSIFKAPRWLFTLSWKSPGRFWVQHHIFRSRSLLSVGTPSGGAERHVNMQCVSAAGVTCSGSLRCWCGRGLAPCVTTRAGTELFAGSSTRSPAPRRFCCSFWDSAGQELCSATRKYAFLNFFFLFCSFYPTPAKDGLGCLFCGESNLTNGFSVSANCVFL